MARVLIVTAILLFFATAVYAQPDEKGDQFVTFIMKDGSKVEGILIQYVGGHFLVRTDEKTKLDIKAKDVEAVVFGNKDERERKVESILKPGIQGRDPVDEMGDLGMEEPGDKPDDPERNQRDFDRHAENMKRHINEMGIEQPMPFLRTVMTLVEHYSVNDRIEDLTTEYTNIVKEDDGRDFESLFKKASVLIAAYIDQQDFVNARKYMKLIGEDKRKTDAIEKMLDFCNTYIERKEGGEELVFSDFINETMENRRNARGEDGRKFPPKPRRRDLRGPREPK